jgi:hypothetical protein
MGGAEFQRSHVAQVPARLASPKKRPEIHLDLILSLSSTKNPSQKSIDSRLGGKDRVDQWISM